MDYKIYKGILNIEAPTAMLPEIFLEMFPNPLYLFRLLHQRGSNITKNKKSGSVALARFNLLDCNCITEDYEHKAECIYNSDFLIFLSVCNISSTFSSIPQFNIFPLYWLKDGAGVTPLLAPWVRSASDRTLRLRRRHPLPPRLLLLTGIPSSRQQRVIHYLCRTRDRRSH